MNDIRPCGNNEKWCESCVSKGKCNYTKKQDIIAEFEKIKTKMEVIHNRYAINFQGHSMSVAQECIDIIDNEIAELKGEKNEKKS